MRLIDADALKKDLTRFYDNEVTAKQLIDEQPTIKQDPCGDAISRQAVEDACDQSINLFEAVDRIKELPPVKPAEKVGQWKSIRYWYECDKCGESNLENTNYCPNCGAKMASPTGEEVEE